MANAARRWIRWPGRGVAAAVAALVLAAVGSVLGHDLYCYATFDQSNGVLCERDDGTSWRDPSNGCTGGEDPECAADIGCSDSVIVQEPAVESCSWFVMKARYPATPAEG